MSFLHFRRNMMATAKQKVQSTVVTKEQIQQYIVETSSTLPNLEQVYVDRFGHVILKTTSGKVYRYKIQQRVIRKEVQVTMSATQYRKASKEWIRVNSLPVTRIKEKIVSSL